MLPYCIIKVRIHSMQFARGNLIQGPIYRDVGTAENIDSICPLQHLEIDHFFPTFNALQRFSIVLKKILKTTCKVPRAKLASALWHQLCGFVHCPPPSSYPEKKHAPHCRTYAHWSSFHLPMTQMFFRSQFKFRWLAHAVGWSCPFMMDEGHCFQYILSVGPLQLSGAI